MAQSDVQEIPTHPDFMGPTPLEDEDFGEPVLPTPSPKLNLIAPAPSLDKPWPEKISTPPNPPRPPVPTPAPTRMPLPTPPPPAPLPRATTPARPPDLEPIVSDAQTVAFEMGDERLIAKTETVPVEAEPTSLWRLLGAFLVDGAVLGGILYLGVVMVASRNGQSPLSVVSSKAWALKLLLAGLALCWMYGTVFAAFFQGRSLGRWMFGIQLLDAQGQPPTLLRAVARSTLGIVSFVLFVGGFWMALVSQGHQTLHDKLTKVFPVRRRA